ncbi:hypothetical protein, partial [Saccharicrinis fermentans]|uniref:hypothetical protein n=1 Tax=Saccharicrinis fermentans TaxID=982 RepID=UPI0005C6DAAB
ANKDYVLLVLAISALLQLSDSPTTHAASAPSVRHACFNAQPNKATPFHSCQASLFTSVHDFRFAPIQ